MVYQDIIDDIISVLQNDGVILYPTDTIWGLGSDPFSEKAVDRIFEIKEREKQKKFVLIVDSITMLKNYVTDIHPRLDTLLNYHKRPMTVIYERPKNLPDYLLEADGSVAIRVVEDDFCKQLIGSFGKPLIATSANVSNERFPSHFGEISSAIFSKVDHVVKLRHHIKEPGLPSIIVKMTKKGELEFIRE